MDTIVPDDVTRHILARYESGDLITTCAWCRRADLEGAWPRVPPAALAAIDQLNTLTHSICPSCMAERVPRAT